MANVQPKPRLTPEQVLQIYSVRPARRKDNTFIPCTKFTRELAAQFDINERTVRDIWNRRTRREITRAVWTVEELTADLNDAAAAGSSSTSTSSSPSLALSSTQPDTLLQPSSSCSVSSTNTMHSPLQPPAASLSTAPPSPSSQPSFDVLLISEEHAHSGLQYFPEDQLLQWVEEDQLLQWEDDGMEFAEIAESKIGEDPFWKDWTRAVERARSIARCQGDQADCGERTRKSGLCTWSRVASDAGGSELVEHTSSV